MIDVAKITRTRAPGSIPSSVQAGRLVRVGLWILLGAIFPLGVWIAIAPLAMAVVAPAHVKVDLNRRPVQHREGGIVREVLVRDGQQVNAGDPILMLGDVGVEADRNRLAYRTAVERATLARLEAEQMLAEQFSFPEPLRWAAKGDPRVQEALTKERALFEARRGSLLSEQRLMRDHRGRVEQEIAALQTQLKQAGSALAIQEKILEANRGLLKDGFISPMRVGQIEATVMNYAAGVEQQRSELSRAEQRLLDIDLRIRTASNEYVRAASDQLRAVAGQLGELEQELRKSEDAAARQLVAAPAAGKVLALNFTSPGAVVAPGDTIAEIVPSDAKLMIEARIRPEDVNHVHLGQGARIRFTAFKYRSTLLVTGNVTYVSADRLVDRASNLPYYTVMIAADGQSLARAGDITLQAGMPAEVYLDGSKQTPLQYLIEPIVSTVRRAGREM